MDTDRRTNGGKTKTRQDKTEDRSKAETKQDRQETRDATDRKREQGTAYKKTETESVEVRGVCVGGACGSLVRCKASETDKTPTATALWWFF